MKSNTGFTTTSGVVGLMLSAINNNEKSPKAKYFFDQGDLNQMAQQKSLLLQNHIAVFMNNVYPGVTTEEEYKQGLQLIWKYRCAGWWNYGQQYMKYLVCLPEDYVNALSIADDTKEAAIKRLTEIFSKQSLVRHEFQEKPGDDVFVVFDNMPILFWRRAQGIHHLFENFNFRLAMICAEKNQWKHKIYHTIAFEYLHYVASADETQQKYAAVGMHGDIPVIVSNL